MKIIPKHRDGAIKAVEPSASRVAFTSSSHRLFRGLSSPLPNLARQEGWR